MTVSSPAFVLISPNKVLPLPIVMVSLPDPVVTSPDKVLPLFTFTAKVFVALLPRVSKAALVETLSV